MEQPSSEFTSESSAVGNDPEALPDK